MLCLSVLDVSEAAIRLGRERLPHAPITWIHADVTSDWTAAPVDLWHDRATFHFLTGCEDRRRYVDALKRTLKPGGQAVIAAFSVEGPTCCSGLPVVRYSPEALAAELGPSFRLIDAVPELHRTPAGAMQAFTYSRLAFDGPQVPAGRDHGL